MANQENSFFTDVSVRKAVLTFTIPTVISQLITVVYNMADTFFIGQLNDPLQVAAATLSMPCFILLTGFANLFGIGGASLISRCLGSNQRQKARHTASFCVWTGAVVAFLYGILIISSESFLFPILGVSDETYEYVKEYIFWTIGVGALPTVMNAELAHLIRAEGYSKSAGFGVAFGGIMNIILDPIFIFVLQLNIKGAAMATMLSNCVATLYFIGFIFSIRGNSVISLNIKYYSTEEKIPSEVISVGFPGSIMTVMATVSNLALNNIIAGYSNKAVAGIGIAKKIDTLAFRIAQGMGQGTLPLIGYCYSSNNKKRMVKTIKTALSYSLTVAVFATVILYFGATPIVESFISDFETVEYGKRFLKILALSCPTTAINFMVITVFQAIGMKRNPFILSILRKGSLDVIFMIILKNTVGISEIAWATPFADWFAFVISILMIVPYLKNINKEIKSPNHS